MGSYNIANNFNPRSLAGATVIYSLIQMYIVISIHAPSRERPSKVWHCMDAEGFQSTLPRGSDLTPVPTLLAM